MVVLEILAQKTVLAKYWFDLTLIDFHTGRSKFDIILETKWIKSCIYQQNVAETI